MPTPDPNIGTTVATGDRLVGAGFKDANGKYQVVQLTAGGAIPVDAAFSPSGTQDVNITQVGGNAVTTTVPVSGAVTTDGLTDAELRATPVPVSGTVTANAGTNLNTSALALESTLSTLNGKVTAVNTGAVTISAALPAGTNNIGDVDIASIAAGDNNIGNVDIVTMPAVTVTGVSTLAEQQTQTAHLASIAGEDFATQTTLSALNGKVTACNTGAVVISSALPAGTNNIGDVDIVSGTITTVSTVTSVTQNADVRQATAANLNAQVVGPAGHDAAISGNPVIMGGVSSAAAPSSVSADQEAVRAWYLRNGAAATVLTAAGALIGGDAANGIDVDVTRLPTLAAVTTVSTVSALGISTTGPQKAEDVAAAGGDMGIAAMHVRLDTPVANAGVSNDGDYTTPILDNFRKQWVTGTVPEDTAHVAGEAISTMGARRIDTCATSADTSGDWATVNQSAEGAVYVTTAPTTTSGLSVANFNTGDTYTALTGTAQVIKASAGNLYGYYIYNPNSSATYVLIYNIAAASVTVGTSTAQMVFCIPATAAANLMFPYPISFSNAGWSIAATTTGGGNTNPTTALEAMIWYK